MSIPENDALSTDNKSGGEGGTPGLVEVSAAEVEVDSVEIDEADNKSGGEGGTPG
jgi:hypothetical protein